MTLIRPLLKVWVRREDDGSWTAMDDAPEPRTIKVNAPTYSEALALMGPALREGWFLKYDPENA